MNFTSWFFNSNIYTMQDFEKNYDLFIYIVGYYTNIDIRVSTSTGISEQLVLLNYIFNFCLILCKVEPKYRCILSIKTKLLWN